MFKNIKWLRLTPTTPGHGGFNTGSHTFQTALTNEIRNLQGGYVYQGTWRREFESAEYPTPQNSDMATTPMSLHAYVYPSTTDPAAEPGVTILCHQVARVGLLLAYSSIWDVSMSGPTPLTYAGTWQPAVFQNINGRCFVGTGLTEARVLDHRTPAIHEQRSQPLGISAPSQALPLTNTTSFTPYGTGYAYKGSVYITHPNPNNLLGTIEATDNVTIGNINMNTNPYSGVLGMGTTPNANAVTSNVTPFAATGTISITTGTSLVTLAGATWPAGFAYCGLSINFGGFSFVIADHGVQANAFDINGNALALSNTQLLILGVYNGPTLVGVPYTITGCRLDMSGGGGAASGMREVNFGNLGYEQTTNANLCQVGIFAIRSNNLFRNLGNISFGPVGGGTRNMVTDGAMFAGDTQLTSATAPWTADDEGSTIVVDGAALAANSILVTTIQTYFAPDFVRLAGVNASGGDITNKRCWWGVGFVTCTDATIVAPGTPATVTSASNPWFFDDIGKTIMISKAAVGGVTAEFTTITGFTNAGEIEIATAGAAVAGVTAVWGSGTANTHPGPQYAYAWYDPETGHMSNISPTFTIPKPVTPGQYSDFANLTPIFQVDSGYFSVPDAVDGVRFSHIMFFRTLSAPGSSTLYPIGSLNPFVGKVHPGSASTRGSWNPGLLGGWMGYPNSWLTPFPTSNGQWWYDFSSDSDLILSGGIRAPQYTNAKPMVLLRGGATEPGQPYCLVYWDRRTWVVNTQEPTKIAFSCDEAQCPLGVPEESFPPTNYLRLPGQDGRVIGMRTIGDKLLITTERFAYIVAGNNESNYRLLKVSSSMPGVGTYQMDEFPTYSGAEGEPTTVFFLGRDRIVYQWTVGGATVPVSQPVQDILDAFLMQSVGYTKLLNYQNARVHCVSAWGRRAVVVGPFSGTTMSGGLPTLIFDVDNRIWSGIYRGDGTGDGLFAYGIAPMTTVYGLDPPVNELYAIGTQSQSILVRSWMRDDQATARGTFQLGTFPMNFDGKKTRKQIIAVNLHATKSTNWTMNLLVNETVSFPAAFVSWPDPLDSIYASQPTAGGITAPTDPDAEDVVVMSGHFGDSTPPIIGYRFTLQILSSDTVPGQIYAVDIAYKEEEEPGEAVP